MGRDSDDAARRSIRDRDSDDPREAVRRLCVAKEATGAACDAAFDALMAQKGLSRGGQGTIQEVHHQLTVLYARLLHEERDQRGLLR